MPAAAPGANALKAQLKAKLLDWLKLAGCAALGLPVLLYFLQERMIFFPQPLLGDPRKDYPGAAIEDIGLTMRDRVQLRGWLVKSGATQASAPILIYFGGNAEEVSWLAASAGRYAGWSLLLMNYRGYGASEGKPGETELFADALQIYDYARARAAGGRVAVMGRSLGSGVAVHLAAQRPLAGVILVSPYDSIESVAKSIYPYLPIGLLLKHRFDSVSRAPAIRLPLLCLVASEDRVIARPHSERLYAAWGGPKQWREIGPADHDSLAGEDAYWEAIAAFLRRLA